MQSRGKRILALLLCALMLLTSIPFDVNNVFAATYDVHQSRRIADIDDFPVSYQAGLTRVKEIYPNAQFIYYDTDLDWYKDLLTEDAQLKPGLNLIPSGSPSSWKSNDSAFYNPTTNTYKEIEPGWNQASTEIIEYYMDPRNFFNETDIFQFLNLAFDGSQTVVGTQGVLSGSFMEKKTLIDNDGNELSFAEALYQIGKDLGVSPYLLACRIRQEQGGEGSMINGQYSKVPGYYNYFNIHAAGSTTEKILTQGLEYAKSQGWNTPYKSIAGGAKFLVNNYVDAGRNCLYLQHFNMAANKSNNVTYAIYMANTLAPYYENRMMAKSLTDKNAPYTFIIPVYDNMPKDPCEMPSGRGSGSAHLKSLKLNDGEISIGKFSSDDYSYKATVENLSVINLTAQTQVSSAKLTINGMDVVMDSPTVLSEDMVLSGGFNTIVITVTAENGLCRDYVLDIVNNDGQAHYRATKSDLQKEKAIVKHSTTVSKLKEDIEAMNCVVLVADSLGTLKNNSDMCVSGDIVIIKTNDNNLVYSAPIIVYGDVDYDGSVTYEDVNIVKNHMLEISTLSLDGMMLADLNFDGMITLDDLGAMRVLVDTEFDTYNPDLSITVDVPSDVCDGKTTTVTLKASDGTYLAEGYLIYNEGLVVPTNAENSGRIHFITDGNELIFDNGNSYVEFDPLPRSGTIDFDVEIVDTFDYLLNKDVNVVLAGNSTSIKNAEIEVDVFLNDNLVEGSKKQHSATMTIKNVSSMSIGNMSITLGEHFSNKSGEQKFDLNGLRPGDSHKVEIYLDKNLASGVYASELKVQYQDAKCVESLMYIPLSFEISSHECEKKWESNENEHYATCGDCGKKHSEKHVFVNLSNGVYRCADCSYIKVLALSIEQGDSTTNASTVYTPTMYIDGKSVDIRSVTLEWIVDGEIITNRTKLAHAFNSVGYRVVDCVAKTKDGLVVTASVVTYTSQPEKMPDTSIVVSNVTCKSILVKSRPGYEYRLDNGDWQSTSSFTNLTPGTYTVYQRAIGKNQKIDSVKVVVNHKVLNDGVVNNTCGEDVVAGGKCSFCGTVATRVMPGTAQQHVFIKYKAVESATCQHGTVEKAVCEHEWCKAENTRTLNDNQSHKFSNYTYDNNATCINGGTNTAYCDYECGATDIAPAYIEVDGHKYIYTKNNDAKVDSSMTETGVCEKCNATNTRTVIGTRLERITRIDIEMSAATTNQGGFPTITTKTVGMNSASTIWQNSSGVTFNGNARDVVLKNNETYKLITLILTVDDQHALNNSVELYINGKLFAGQGVIDGKTIMFSDVGQFQFKDQT